MAQNRQLQKVVNIHSTRIRHRRRLLTTFPRFAGRHAGLSNFLIREATRANATPERAASLSVGASGGAGYAIGDIFELVPGAPAATGMVTAEAAGVVTAVKVLKRGIYAIIFPDNPTVTITGSGAGLLINIVQSNLVVGVTDAELLAGIRSMQNLAATIPTITRARHFRNPRQTDQTYLENGVPVV